MYRCLYIIIILLLSLCCNAQYVRTYICTSLVMTVWKVLKINIIIPFGHAVVITPNPWPSIVSLYRYSYYISLVPLMKCININSDTYDIHILYIDKSGHSFDKTYPYVQWHLVIYTLCNIHMRTLCMQCAGLKLACCLSYLCPIYSLWGCPSQKSSFCRLSPMLPWCTLPAGICVGLHSAVFYRIPSWLYPHHHLKWYPSAQENVQCLQQSRL